MGRMRIKNLWSVRTVDDISVLTIIIVILEYIVGTNKYHRCRGVGASAGRMRRTRSDRIGTVIWNGSF